MHEHESISRLSDNGPKDIARMSQRLVNTTFGDFNGGPLAREPDPTHPGRYKYELVTSLTCYINLLNARVEELRRHKRRQ